MQNQFRCIEMATNRTYHIICWTLGIFGQVRQLRGYVQAIGNAAAGRLDQTC